MEIETIALLIREPAQIGNCLSSIDLLCRLKAQVKLILLGSKDLCDRDQTICRLQAFQDAGIECFADAPGEMQARGFQILDPDRIAQLVTRADMVIAL